LMTSILEEHLIGSIDHNFNIKWKIENKLSFFKYMGLLSFKGDKW
jgi:hypothetical protein